MEKTIVAIATPPGEGAIGILRLSGVDAIQVADKIFKSRSLESLELAEPKKMYYGYIVDHENIVDEVMLVTYKVNQSYTKENMVEIFTHGGYIAITEVLNLVIRQGAIAAEPGEFTKRAFLNGRIDLVQAESIMDMVSAKSKVGFIAAVDNLQGKFSNSILKISNVLTDLIAQIEVIIDYPDEDIEFITRRDILVAIDTMIEQVNRILSTYNAGKIVKDGIQMAIVGKPNVGKSSLMNAFLRDSRAIVTHYPGTTRDVLTEMIQIEGISFNLIDTAGIRETSDYVENIGIQKAKATIDRSDLVLLVMDQSSPHTSEDVEIIDYLKDKKKILILNKTDLKQGLDIAAILGLIGDTEIIKCSLLDDADIQLIESSIVSYIYNEKIILKEGNLLTNARHFSILENASSALSSARNEIISNTPLDLIQFNLHEAYRYLGEITGKTIDVDIVSTIFSKFCLGK